MLDYYVDLGKFPPGLHRIVKSWYSWQAVYLRETGSDPEYEAIAGQITWRTHPPRMTKDGELCFIDDDEISNYLVIEGNQYYIDKKSRGSRGRYWMFRRFEDAEKYMLFLISQMARPGRYTKSPAFRWYQKGVDPRVTLTKPDPVDYPGRVSLRVDHEANDRGWMGETDAPAGSHVLVLSFEELDSVLREGIPADWFTVNVRSD
jgi:hypothetical protein